MSNGAKVSDHLANERTYLAWIRTGITVIALGFVVARFGLILKELIPSTPTTSFHFSSFIGITLIFAGGLMELLALKRYVRNRERIRIGKYELTTGIEFIVSTSTFAIAMVLIVYLLLAL